MGSQVRIDGRAAADFAGRVGAGAFSGVSFAVGETVAGGGVRGPWGGGQDFGDAGLRRGLQ